MNSKMNLQKPKYICTGGEVAGLDIEKGEITVCQMFKYLRSVEHQDNTCSRDIDI